jgi:hypothetical protein
MFGDLKTLKSQFGIQPGDTSEDTLIGLFMNQASAAIETWCDRQFSQALYTQYLLGNGLSEIDLLNRPIYPLGTTNFPTPMAVYEDENGFWGSNSSSFDPTTTLLTYGTDYAMEIDQQDGSSRSGILYKINGFWTIPFTYRPGVISSFTGPGTGNIKVVYVGGYSAVPPDIQLALFLQIAAVRNAKNYGHLLASESRGDGAGSTSYSAQLRSKAGILTPEVTSLLAAYRNIAM